jgi:hypothetical protein
MSAPQPSLTIAYTGELVAVDPERITEEMFVPNVGYDDDLRADDQPGASAVSLFREAESEGALVIPDSLAVACHARDDLRFSGKPNEVKTGGARRPDGFQVSAGGARV